jgi:mannose-6-phosphate isomerase-like protein (cupin superfamily)
METSAHPEKRSLDSPDERRPAGAGEGKVINLSGLTFLHLTLQPGWKWSKDVKPIAKTESCQAMHVGYVISGHMHGVMDDGTEMELGPGDFYSIPPGHDAWVVGDEPYVGVDVNGSAKWARPS